MNIYLFITKLVIANIYLFFFVPGAYLIPQNSVLNQPSPLNSFRRLDSLRVTRPLLVPCCLKGQRDIYNHRRNIKSHLSIVSTPRTEPSDQTYEKGDFDSRDLKRLLLNPKRMNILKYLVTLMPASRIDFAIARYGVIGKDIYEKLIQFGYDYTELLVDVGLIIRLDEFIEFAISRYGSPTSMDPWSVRESFSIKLGYHKSFRAMTLNKQQLNFIMEHGIFSHALLHEFKQKDILDKSQDNYEKLDQHFSSFPLSRVITDHQMNCRDKPNDFMISTSDFLEVALTACTFANMPNNENNLYVFTVNVPILDSATFWDQEHGLSSNEKRYGKAIENLVFWIINREEIELIEQLDPNFKLDVRYGFEICDRKRLRVERTK